VMLSAEDYDADLAEQYGWINRALPANKLSSFVKSLAHRIAAFPASGRATVKEIVNAICLPSVNDFRNETDLFYKGIQSSEYQDRMQGSIHRGFQKREVELDLAGMLGNRVTGVTKKEIKSVNNF